MTFDILSAIAAENGLMLSKHQLLLLETYANLLKQHNQQVNLISRKDEDNIIEKHILHSLTVAMPAVTGYEIPNKSRVFDIGAGGGLPGIPLKIVREDISLTLCDSIGKKMKVVEQIISELDLKETTTYHGRAEEFSIGKQGKKIFDVVVSRAVAPLDNLIQWTVLLLKPHTTVLSLKGGNLDEEIKRSKIIPLVKNVYETPLALQGYDGFLIDDKKLIRVEMK